MAKAHITSANGTKVTVEGTPEEVAEMLKRIQGVPSGKPEAGIKASSRNKFERKGPLDLVSDLIDGGFFKTPRELSAIREALQEQGHHYPATTLSPIVLRLVRKKYLRRIKDNNRWTYVG